MPIPELVAEVEPKTLSFIVTDLRKRRLAGCKKSNIWRAPQDSRDRMPALLPEKFCPAALGGAGGEVGRGVMS